MDLADSRLSDTVRVRTRAREGFGGTGSKLFSSTGRTWLGTVGAPSQSRGGRKVLLEDAALSELQPGLTSDEWPADCPFLLQSRPFGSRTLPPSPDCSPSWPPFSLLALIPLPNPTSWV